MLKKCIAICLCFVALTGILSACNEPQTGNDSLSSYDFPTAVPVFADDKQVEIMAFWSPPINETQYTWLKECGITAVLVDNKYNANTGTNRKKILTMCGELALMSISPWIVTVMGRWWSSSPNGRNIRPSKAFTATSRSPKSILIISTSSMRLCAKSTRI